MNDIDTSCSLIIITPGPDGYIIISQEFNQEQTHGQCSKRQDPKLKKVMMRIIGFVLCLAVSIIISGVFGILSMESVMMIFYESNFLNILWLFLYPTVTLGMVTSWICVLLTFIYIFDE